MHFTALYKLVDSDKSIPYKTLKIENIGVIFRTLSGLVESATFKTFIGIHNIYISSMGGFISLTIMSRLPSEAFCSFTYLQIQFS